MREEWLEGGERKREGEEEGGGDVCTRVLLSVFLSVLWSLDVLCKGVEKA